MSERKEILARRDFIKYAATAFGSAIFAGWQTPRGLGTPAEGASTGLAPGSYADSILVNGRVVTVDRADTISEAIAIREGKILQTGSNEAIRALAGEATQVIDLRNRTVTPGLMTLTITCK